MSGYRIAAYPTRYRGRLYRSRLEARWAAFFDLMGWQHEYEPFDLGAWSPDFVLRGGAGDVLVEVKPDWSPCREVSQKLGRVCAEGRLPKQADWILFLGVSPHVVPGVPWPVGGYADVTIPGLTDVLSWEPVHIGWVPGQEGVPSRPDFMMAMAEWDWRVRVRFGLLTGGEHTAEMDDPLSRSGRAMEIWAEATNAVQWKPKGRRT